MSAEDRRARYLAKPGNRAKKAAHEKSVRRARKAVAAAAAEKALETSSVLEYRRGVLHGLTAARAVAYNFNGGRSWTNSEIAHSITALTQDLPGTIVAIGDALNSFDEVSRGHDIQEALCAPRRQPWPKDKAEQTSWGGE